MKENKILENSNFYHKGADQLLKTEIPKVENDIKAFSMDLAEQSRPTIEKRKRCIKISTILMRKQECCVKT